MSVINPFAGCLPHLNAHPIRPWWRFEYIETRMKKLHVTEFLTWMHYRWVRSDGVSFTDQRICDWSLEPTPPFREIRGDLTEMDRLDHLKPILRPPELPLQIWVAPEIEDFHGSDPRGGGHLHPETVLGGWVFYTKTNPDFSMQFALIFGPFAPWASPAWVDLHRKTLEDSLWP